MKIVSWANARLVAWVMGLSLIGSLLGFVTRTQIDTWYQTLLRSPLTPPNYMFGVVWSMLYIMIAISGWLIWESKSFASQTDIKRLYIAQLLLNWMWTPLFFVYHLTGVALLCLTMIVVLVTAFVIRSYQDFKPVALMMLPYLLWLCFAGYLNGYIWIYN